VNLPALFEGMATRRAPTPSVKESSIRTKPIQTEVLAVMVPLPPFLIVTGTTAVKMDGLFTNLQAEVYFNPNEAKQSKVISCQVEA
jgi:hypothetical protein